MNILIKINKEVFKHTVCIKGNFDITISNTPVTDTRQKYHSFVFVQMDPVIKVLMNHKKP